MSDNQFYEQVRQQFDWIIEQDKHRRRRIASLLLAFHLFLVIAAAVYMWQRATGFWGYSPTEVVLVLWAMLALSFFVHLAAVLYMNRTVVADTVRESLMLLAARQYSTDTPDVAEKRKRSRGELDIDALEPDSLIIAEDGELQRIQQRRR